MRNSLNNKKAVIELIAISFLSLFLELALIRFISSNVQVVAYFNNFLILSAFLGLGFGSIIVDKKYNLFSIFPIVFALFIALISVLDRFGYIIDLSENLLWVGVGIDYPNLPAPIVIILVFCCNFIFFVPLGFRLGQSLKKFENRLIAYAFDLFGSFLGVAGFFLMSYLQTAPYIWFAISGVITLSLLGKNIKKPKYYLRILFIIIAIFIASIEQQVEWSPYYKISCQPYKPYTKNSDEFPGYMILVDNLRIQDAFHFSEKPG